MVESGVRVTPPGPSHWKSGVPVTPSGRVTEQVRVIDSPAMTEEEGEEVREMVAGSAVEDNKNNRVCALKDRQNTYGDMWCSNLSTE